VPECSCASMTKTRRGNGVSHLLWIILLNSLEVLNERSLDLRGVPFAFRHSADVRTVNSQAAGDSAVYAAKRVNETTYSVKCGGVLAIGHLLHSCGWTA
jgi:hypothetical protein